jgi:hypothetical protein
MKVHVALKRIALRSLGTIGCFAIVMSCAMAVWNSNALLSRSGAVLAQSCVTNACFFYSSTCSTGENGNGDPFCTVCNTLSCNAQ